MTHFNQKEEEFKNILKNLSLGIDSNAVWDSIEYRLPSNKNEMKLPFGIWLLCGLFLIGMSSLFFINPSESSISITAEETNTAPLASEDRVEELYAKTQAYEEAIDKVSQSKSEEGTIQVSIEQHTENINDNRINQKAHQPIIRQKIAPSDLHTNSLVTKPTLGPKPLLLENNNSTNLADQAKADNESLWRTSISELIPIATLKSPLVLHKEINLASMEIEPYKPTRSLYRTSYFSLAMGPSLTRSEYTIADQSSEPNLPSSFAAPEEINESDLIGYSAQFEYGQVFNKWRFFTGANYSISAARYIDDDLNVSVQERVSSITGASSYESTYTQNDIRRHRFHNALDVKLGLGYELITKKGLRLSINLSGAVNLYSKHSGYYLDDDLTTAIKFAAAENHNYRTSRGIGSQLNLTFEKRIGSKVGLIVTPYLNNYYSPLNKNSTSYNIENSQVGLLMGISYRPVWE